MTDNAAPGSITDEREGFPRYRTQVQNMTDQALRSEYHHMLRATFDRIFQAGKRMFPIVEEEYNRRFRQEAK